MREPAFKYSGVGGRKWEWNNKKDEGKIDSGFLKAVISHQG